MHAAVNNMCVPIMHSHNIHTATKTHERVRRVHTCSLSIKLFMHKWRERERARKKYSIIIHFFFNAFLACCLQHFDLLLLRLHASPFYSCTYILCMWLRQCFVFFFCTRLFGLALICMPINSLFLPMYCVFVVVVCCWCLPFFSALTLNMYCFPMLQIILL